MLEDTTSTKGRSEGNLTLEKLQKMFELLKDTKQIIILFTPFVPKGKGYWGVFVDKMLGCKENEEGFIVSEEDRKVFEEYKDAYREWHKI